MARRDNRGTKPIDMGAKSDASHAQDIMLHYARKGLSPMEVRARARRHARVLSSIDPGVALALGNLRAGEAVARVRLEKKVTRRRAAACHS